MTARTVANSTRQAAEQDALLQSSDTDMTPPARPRIRLHVRKPTTLRIAPANDDDDAAMENTAADETIEPEDKESDEEYWADDLICYCRKPEDFTTSLNPDGSTLIACDGPCEEWYHGPCVNITAAEAERIETFICPICVRNGWGKTVWKQMPVRIGENRVDSEEDFTLSGFPRRTAIERKREHRVLSRRAEGLVRTRGKRWDEGRGGGWAG